MEHGVVDGITIQAPEAGLVMVQHQHQAQGLIAAGSFGHRVGPGGADTGGVQQMTQTLDRLGIEVPLAQAAATAVNPAHRTVGEARLEAPTLTPELGAEGFKQRFDLGEPEVVGDRMHPDRLERALVIATEQRHRQGGQRDCLDADKPGDG